jgi:hypothetical protein
MAHPRPYSRMGAALPEVLKTLPYQPVWGITVPGCGARGHGDHPGCWCPVTGNVWCESGQSQWVLHGDHRGGSAEGTEDATDSMRVLSDGTEEARGGRSQWCTWGNHDGNWRRAGCQELLSSWRQTSEGTVLSDTKCHREPKKDTDGEKAIGGTTRMA